MLVGGPEFSEAVGLKAGEGVLSGMFYVLEPAGSPCGPQWLPPHFLLLFPELPTLQL